MSIVFRCPGCDHKLRASTSAAGKKSKCKCGALVTIPGADGPAEADDDEAVRGAWRLEPRFNAANGDLCEAITAWSPLCAPNSATPAARDRGPAAGYWRGLLVGTLGVLALSLIVAGLFHAFQSRIPQADANPPGEQAANDRLAKPADQNSQNKEPATPKAPADKDNIKGGAGADPAQEKEPNTEKQPEKTEEPKKPPVADPDRIEIIAWRTFAKLAIIGDSGKEEPLELNDDAVKDGVVFVAVTARVPAKVLKGKKFVVESLDVVLSAPNISDPYRAFGCAIDERLWYAPSKGQRDYAAPREGIILESWLFIAPLKELESGSTTFQIKDQRAVLLTSKNRRAQAP